MSRATPRSSAKSRRVSGHSPMAVSPNGASDAPAWGNVAVYQFNAPARRVNPPSAPIAGYPTVFAVPAATRICARQRPRASNSGRFSERPGILEVPEIAAGNRHPRKRQVEGDALSSPAGSAARPRRVARFVQLPLRHGFKTNRAVHPFPGKERIHRQIGGEGADSRGSGPQILALPRLQG